MLVFLLFFFAGWILLGAGVSLASIDRPRRPITAGVGFFTLIVALAMAATLVWAALSL